MTLAIAVSVGLIGCASSQPTQSEESETVNIGYGKQEADEVTSATSTRNPTEQDQDTATRFSDLLKGQTAGVQVDQAPNGTRVTIRGVNTINADTSPLYVIDGMTVEPNYGGTVPVHPRDVKSITVLKGAGATSMYGSRGANGVIVIETKDQ